MDMTIAILLVEDNPGDARLVQELLREVAGDGIRVEHKTRLADGLQCLHNARYDVALLDLGLPDGRGLDVVAQVRNAFPDVPIVVLTGSDDTELAMSAVKSGAQDYLIKGRGDGDLLLRSIQYAIGRTHNLTALRDLAQAVSSVTGQKFFNALVKQLCRHFDVAHAFVAEIDHGATSSFRTIALWMHGEIADNLILPMEGSPCEVLKSNQPCYSPSGVQLAYPHDLWLKRLYIDSFMGIPLANAAGEVVGLLAVMDGKPMNCNLLVEQQLLQVFAGRTVAELERRNTEAMMHNLASAMEQSADIIMITNLEGVITYVNAAFEQASGFRREEAIGQKPRLVRSNQQGDAFYAKLWATLKKGEVFRATVVNRRKDGTLYHEDKTITPLRNADQEIAHYLSSGKDITEDLKTQEQIHNLTYLNPLTGLPNRALFLDRLTQLLTRGRWQNRIIALLFVNLDRFRVVNDSLGHKIGDSALQLMPGRLKGCIREGDTLSHLGGDQFAIFLQDMDSPDDVPRIAQSILDVIARPAALGGDEFVLTASIGIALYPHDGETTQDLMRCADTALHKAKIQGGNSFRFFTADIQANALESLSLASNLHRALERNEFRVHYQPQYHSNTMEMVGVEALVRWEHPEKGMLPPGQFIPILEETGMIVSVGEWVLQAACRQAKSWQVAGFAPVRVAVNLSARQLNETGLVETVARALADTGLEPEHLELEVTESMLMHDIELTITTLDALAKMGVAIAIDDYGTGYSSLAYLKRLHVDVLKLDQSFVKGIGHDADDEAIVASTISMAHRLGLTVIAEGVETESQLEFLRLNACDSVQGYLFSRPIPAEGILGLLQHST
jgi:diguanylate cyclase (GGDEF)-like protein/PAS domain S-box-containing protein